MGTKVFARPLIWQHHLFIMAEYHHLVQDVVRESLAPKRLNQP